MIIFTNIINGRTWRNISNACIFRCFRKYNSMDNGDDIQLIVEAKAFTFDTSGSSNHNNENNVEESSSIGTENVRNNDGPRFIDTITKEWCDFGGGSNGNNSVDDGNISAMSPFSLDDNNNNDGNFNNNNDEDDGEDTIPDDSCNDSNSNASNENDNGNNNGKNNSNNNGSNNDIYSSTPAINRARTPIPSRGHQSNPLCSPMTTRRNTSPNFFRHAQLTPGGRAAQEIRYNKKGSPTIVGDLNHIGFDNIENYNHNHNNNNNNNNEEEEGEELLCPRKKLDFEPVD